jgi:hypothetical protein
VLAASALPMPLEEIVDAIAGLAGPFEVLAGG